MSDQRRTIRRVRFPIGGALIAFIIEAALQLVQGGPGQSLLDANVYPQLALFTFLGGILGALFNTTREMAKALEDSIGQLEKLSTALRYQERALKMLLDGRHHSDLLKRLISDSIEGKFTYIAYVNPIEYLNYLIDAIRHSHAYHGVQRNPVSWFKEKSAEAYLQELKAKKMEEKIRVFMIDDADIDTMQQDLGNQNLMEWYWNCTGQNVQTYWITTKDFDKHWHALGIPDDFALYDRSLLIKYDEPRQVLSFDLIGEVRPEAQIFVKLKEQLKSGKNEPFRIISPPKKARP